MQTLRLKPLYLFKINCHGKAKPSVGPLKHPRGGTLTRFGPVLRLGYFSLFKKVVVVSP